MIGEKTTSKINKVRVDDVYLEGVDFIANLVGIDPVEMMRKSRRRELTTARHALSYYLRKHTHLSLQAIGNLMGGKHHATIMHGCKLIEESAPYDLYIRNIKEAIDNLKVSNNRTLRQEILRCLSIYSNDNTRTEAVIRVINKYVKPNQLEDERN
jgi:hypothetical protein